MSFIPTDQGLVNLRFVKRIRTDVRDDRDGLITLYDSAGFAMGKTDRETLDDHLLGDLVAAGPGVYATVISSTADFQRPRMKDMVADRVPVVAWRVRGSASAVPVFVEPPLGQVFLEAGAGRLILPHEAIFDDLPAVKDFCLQNEQRTWDQQHPTAPVDSDLDEHIDEDSIKAKYDK